MNAAMNTDWVPTAIERTGAAELSITWSDGKRKHYSVAGLRAACPCATCREKHGAAPKKPLTLPVLSLQEARPLSIERMQPVGNYAYNISFSDGHDSGIYTFDHLYELGSDQA